LKRTIYICTALLAFIIAGEPFASAATAAKPASTPAAPKDACLAQKSKWARLQCEGYTHSAPGDEYFGRMKLSYLGINNTFHDEAIRAGDYTTDGGIISKVKFADEALIAWAHKYPNDPQLARSYFLAIAMFKKIYVQDFQDEAWTYMHLIVQKFPTSYFGKLEKADLARGFTEHWFALAEACPTPLPSGVSAPSVLPSATDTPSPRPGSPRVQIITPACVPPATPEPLETPSAAPFPSPSPTPTPQR
jgi:hypothetical protein